MTNETFEGRCVSLNDSGIAGGIVAAAFEIATANRRFRVLLNVTEGKLSTALVAKLSSCANRILNAKFRRPAPVFQKENPDSLMLTIVIPFLIWGVLLLISLPFHPRGTPLLLRFGNSALIACALLLALGAICGSTADDANAAGLPGLQNASMLCATKSLFYGYKIYYMPGEGPVLPSVYPPVAYLFYVPVALPWWSITAQVMAGSCLALAFCALPIFVILWRYYDKLIFPSFAWTAVSFYLLCCFTFRSLYCSTTSTRADAPALGFGALGAVFLFHRTGSASKRDLWLGALCTALACWAKQPMIVLPIILFTLLWVFSGRKHAIPFGVYTGGALILLAIVFSIWFGPRVLFFHLVRIKMRHPYWNSIFSYDLNMKFGGVRDTRGKVKALVTALDLFLPERWALLSLAFTVPCSFLFWRYSKTAGNAPPLSVVFFTIAVILAPIAVLTRAQIGGAKNSYSFFDYYAVIGCLALLVELQSSSVWRIFASGVNSGPKVAEDAINAGDGPVSECRPLAVSGYVLCFACCVILVLGSNFELIRTRKYIDFVSDNPLKESEVFLRTHPGMSYIPSSPLAHLDASGTFYHDENGFFEKFLAFGEGAFVNAERFLPAHITYLVVPAGSGDNAPSDSFPLLRQRLYPGYRYEMQFPGMRYWKILVTQPQPQDKSPVRAE